MNLLDLARSTLQADPAPDAARTATPAEAAELARLLTAILPGDAAGQAEALPIACADPEAALVSFRALAADLPAPPPDPLPALPTCEDCRNLTTLRDRDGFRRCTAAHRRYNPAPDIGRRCENFRPLPDDADQRTGRERWPWLINEKSVTTPNAKPGAGYKAI